MSDFLSQHGVVIGLTFFLAGIVKGATGLGLPTVVMAVLGSLMSPVAAASLLIVPSFVTNFWQMVTGPSLAALSRRLWLMMLGIVVGTLGGSWLLTSASTQWTTIALGAALVLYSGFSLVARPLSVPPRIERYLAPVIGLATGLVTGATGVFAIPAVPYLQALGLSKDELIQALGLAFTTSTVALALGLAWGGAFHLGNLTSSVFAIAPALLGMGVGQWIRNRISPASFRRWFMTSLALLGLELAIRPFL